MCDGKTITEKLKVLLAKKETESTLEEATRIYAHNGKYCSCNYLAKNLKLKHEIKSYIDRFYMKQLPRKAAA